MFTYEKVGEAFSLRDTTFANTVKVVQRYEVNAIEQDDRQEVYAQGVGLIYKRVIDYEYCSNPRTQGNCEVGSGFVINGRKREHRLQSFGIMQ